MARLLLFRGFVGLHIKTISAPHFTPLVDSRRSCDRRVALDAGSYRTLLERMVTKRTVLERMVPERMVLEQSVVPEPQHLTSLALWSARQIPTRRLIREGKTRLDARSFFHSCLISRDFDSPPGIGDSRK